jgi:hypothetical protein
VTLEPTFRIRLDGTLSRAAIADTADRRASAGPESNSLLSAAARPAGRIAALDFTKGLLVLIMVLYHWLNYFVGTEGFYYRYLRFLTPSFIFITGFLIAHVYFTRDGVTNPRVPARLLQRGLKLLGIFTFLNLSIHLLADASHSKAIHDWTAAALGAVYLTGTAPVPFAILVPISYLLLTSAGIAILARSWRVAGQIIPVVFVLLVLLLESLGVKNGYLELFSMGLIGVALGHIVLVRTNRIVRHPYLLLTAYAGYIWAISIWNEVYVLQIVGVCLSLAVIYMLGASRAGSGSIARAVILLGQYSLIGYICQIVLLQALRAGFGHLNLLGEWALVALGAGVALTVLSVQALDQCRARVPVINRLYSAVFS